MAHSGHKPATVAARLAAVRRFYDALTWAELRPDNPATGIRPPRERRADDAGGFLTEADLRVLLHETPGEDLPGKRDRAILGLMAIHGLRTVEIERANVGDLDHAGVHCAFCSLAWHAAQASQRASRSFPTPSRVHVGCARRNPEGRVSA